MPLINCKLSLSLTQSKNCALTDMTTATVGVQENPAAIESLKGTTFTITDTKLSVLVVTFPTESDNKLKTRFKKTIKQNKNKSGMTKINKN